MNGKWLLMAFAIAMWASPVHAQVVKGQDPASLVSALVKAGYTAELGAAQDGDPMITSSASDRKFRIFFMNCTNHKACATVQFFAGYRLETPVTQSRINDWNRDQRFGRAYLDKDGDPVIEMDVDLDDGGVPALLFIDNVEFWQTAQAQFEKHIGYSD